MVTLHTWRMYKSGQIKQLLDYITGTLVHNFHVREYLYIQHKQFDIIYDMICNMRYACAKLLFFGCDI